jgi:hypothetical protein
MMGQGHLARQRHLPPTDQPDIGDGVVRRPKRAGGDEGGALAGEAGDTVHARGFDGLWEGQIQQDGGEPTGQPRLARPGWTQEQDIMVTTPASL